MSSKVNEEGCKSTAVGINAEIVFLQKKGQTLLFFSFWPRDKAQSTQKNCLS